MTNSEAVDTFESLTGLAGPIYFRKIPRRTHWGTSADLIEQRILKTVSNLFKEENNIFSFYRAENVDDLARIALGLNSTRVHGSMKEQIDFISFSEAELLSTGAHVTHTKGNTNCLRANYLHVDVVADISKLEELCRNAFNGNRNAGRLTESWMKKQLCNIKFATCQAITSMLDGCDCVATLTGVQ